MEKSRNSFTSKQKIEFLKKHLLEQVSVSDLCDKFNIHPTVFYRWQKQLFENGEMAFQVRKKPNPPKYERKIAELEAKIQNKNEVLSELMEEHITFKKNLGKFKSSLGSS